MRTPPIVRLLAALSVAATLGTTPLAGQDVPTVAVMDFSSFMMGEGGASVNLGKAISAMLVTEFSGRDGMRIVERAQLNELLREQDLSLSGRIEEADAIEVGKMLGVQYVLHGQVTSIVDNLRMDIRAVDVETSEIVSVMKMSDKGLARPRHEHHQIWWLPVVIHMKPMNNRSLGICKDRLSRGPGIFFSAQEP